MGVVWASCPSIEACYSRPRIMNCPHMVEAITAAEACRTMKPVMRCSHRKRLSRSEVGDSGIPSDAPGCSIVRHSGLLCCVKGAQPKPGSLHAVERFHSEHSAWDQRAFNEYYQRAQTASLTRYRKLSEGPPPTDDSKHCTFQGPSALSNPFSNFQISLRQQLNAAMGLRSSEP